MKEKVRFWGLDVHAETITVAVTEPDAARQSATEARPASHPRRRSPAPLAAAHAAPDRASPQGGNEHRHGLRRHLSLSRRSSSASYHGRARAGEEVGLRDHRGRLCRSVGTGRGRVSLRAAGSRTQPARAVRLLNEDDHLCFQCRRSIQSQYARPAVIIHLVVV